GRGNMVFENDLVHVKRLHLAPERTAQTPRPDPGPDHILPAVVIHLSAAHIQFTYADGSVEEAPMKAGDIRFEDWGSRESPRIKVSAENPGDSIDVVRIQLKAGK